MYGSPSETVNGTTLYVDSRRGLIAQYSGRLPPNLWSTYPGPRPPGDIPELVPFGYVRGTYNVKTGSGGPATDKDWGSFGGLIHKYLPSRLHPC